MLKNKHQGYLFKSPPPIWLALTSGSIQRTVSLWLPQKALISDASRKSFQDKRAFRKYLKEFKDFICLRYSEESGRLRWEGTSPKMRTDNSWKYCFSHFVNKQVTRRLTNCRQELSADWRPASQISNKYHQTMGLGGIPEEPNHCSPNRWREEVVRGQKWRGQTQETFVVPFLSQNRMPEGEGSKQREV